MTHWQFHITPLTPVHIGSGETAEPYEYVIAGETLYRLNLDRFLAGLERDERLRFVDLCGTDIVAARQFVRRRADLARTSAEYRSWASPTARSYYEEKLDDSRSDPTISEQARTLAGALLPGSSLKGALRTALLYAHIPRPLRGYEQPHQQKFFHSQRLQKEVFGHHNPLDDPFKHLKSGDSQPVTEATSLHLVDVRTYKGGVWGTKLSILVQGLRGQLAEGDATTLVHTVSINEEAQQRNPGDFRITMAGLAAAARTFYGEHLRGEAAFLAGLPGAARTYQALVDWTAQMPDHAFLVRLGWGSGLDAVTVNRAQPRPRRTISRRLLADGTPLGWAEVQVLDDEGRPFTVPEEEEVRPPTRVEEPKAQPTSLSDLRPGMKVRGVIHGVVEYGAFVDIGVGRNGLLHISEMTEGYVRNVHEIVREGQEIEVWVISVDLDRQRIGLSLVGPTGKRGRR